MTKVKILINQYDEKNFEEIDETKLAKLVNDSTSKGFQSVIKTWNFPDRKDLYYFTKHKKSESEISDLETKKIVGQWGHYAGQTWGGALLRPKYKANKMRDVLKLYDSNPIYYKEDRNDLSFSSFDGENWFSTEGNNHRAVVARCLGELGIVESLKCVKLTRHYIDVEAYKTYCKLQKFIFLKKLPITISPYLPVEPGEVNVIVIDNRLSQNSASLTRGEFLAYARKVFESPEFCTMTKYRFHLSSLPTNHYLKPFQNL